jgi:hypothetical protein
MARAAASDLASLRSAMRAARDSMAGLTRAINVPTIRTKRTVSKSSTQTSFYTSAAQSASQIYDATMLAQRIL